MEERTRIKETLTEVLQQDFIKPSLVDDFEHNKHIYGLIDKAWALMLVHQNLLGKDDCLKIFDAVEKAEKEMSEESLNPANEDFYFNYHEMMLKCSVDGAGGRLHIGRSRNDIKPAALRIENREAAADIMAALIRLEEAMLCKAKANTDAVITNYTFCQPAQPTTLAHYYAAVLSALSRDMERLQAAYKHANLNSFGAAALSGTSIPIDREIVGKYLGFDGLLSNTHDAAASRDYILELECAEAILMNTISRLADDLLFWSSDEVQTMDVWGGAAFCSSIMPQKKSPCGLQYIRGRCSGSISKVVNSFCAIKNTAYTNVSDGAEMLPGMVKNTQDTISTLRLMADIITNTNVKREQAYSRTANNFCTASGLAEYLSMNYDNVSFAQAHSIVATILSEVLEAQNPKITDITSARIEAASKEILGFSIVLTDEEIQKVLDPMEHLEAKASGGTPKPSDTEKLLAEVENEIERQKSWLSDQLQRVEQAYASMEAERVKMQG